MYRIRQRFDDTKVENIAETVQAELHNLSMTSLKPGQRVAITGGSRGSRYSVIHSNGGTRIIDCT